MAMVMTSKFAELYTCKPCWRQGLLLRGCSKNQTEEKKNEEKKKGGENEENMQQGLLLLCGPLAVQPELSRAWIS